jgi:hypothetical protein
MLESRNGAAFESNLARTVEPAENQSCLLILVPRNLKARARENDSRFDSRRSQAFLQVRIGA